MSLKFHLNGMTKIISCITFLEQIIFTTSQIDGIGNAVYNISHGIMAKMLAQLEREAVEIFNTVPFDLRMGQVNISLPIARFFFLSCFIFSFLFYFSFKHLIFTIAMKNTYPFYFGIILFCLLSHFHLLTAKLRYLYFPFGSFKK